MTSRAYSDLRVLSPDGRLVLEALSPDNGNELKRDGTAVLGRGLRAMQRNFRYQLREAGAGAVLWERWQEGSEPSPVRAYVSDDGYSVVRAHYLEWSSEELLFIDPEGALRLVVVVTCPEGSKHEAGVERQEDEARARGVRVRRVTWPDEHVEAYSGGPHWTGGSMAAFFKAATAHFSLRTWWGRRVVVDLEAMSLVPDTVQRGAIADAATGEEQREALLVLRSMVPRVVDGSAGIVERARLIGALAVVMHQRLGEAAPYLRELECLRAPGLVESSRVLGGNWHTEIALLPTLARLVLRFLGQEPVPGGNYVFRPGAPWASPQDTNARLEVGGGSPASWDEARRLAPGVRPEEVLARIGAPDFIRSCSRKGERLHVWTEVWEYDGSSATTRLWWSFPQNSTRSARERPRPLERVEVVDPPAWAAEERAAALFRYSPG